MRRWSFVLAKLEELRPEGLAILLYRQEEHKQKLVTLSDRLVKKLLIERVGYLFRDGTAHNLKLRCAVSTRPRYRRTRHIRDRDEIRDTECR